MKKLLTLLLLLACIPLTYADYQANSKDLDYLNLIQTSINKLDNDKKINLKNLVEKNLNSNNDRKDYYLKFMLWFLSNVKIEEKQEVENFQNEEKQENQEVGTELNPVQEEKIETNSWNTEEKEQTKKEKRILSICLDVCIEYIKNKEVDVFRIKSENTQIELNKLHIKPNYILYSKNKSIKSIENWQDYDDIYLWFKIVIIEWKKVIPPVIYSFIDDYDFTWKNLHLHTNWSSNWMFYDIKRYLTEANVIYE